MWVTTRVFTAALASLSKVTTHVTGVKGLESKAASIVTPVRVPGSMYETVPPVAIMHSMLQKYQHTFISSILLNRNILYLEVFLFYASY